MLVFKIFTIWITEFENSFKKQNSDCLPKDIFAELSESKNTKQNLDC